MMAGPDKDNERDGNDGGNGSDGNILTDVVIKPKPKTKKPALYRVLMLNDDYTPMEFVIHILERFFAKNRDDSTRIMLHIHRRGVGLCGIYPYDVAETKVTTGHELSRGSTSIRCNARWSGNETGARPPVTLIEGVLCAKYPMQEKSLRDV